MAIKRIIKAWKDNSIDELNLNFLMKPTELVEYPFSKEIKMIVQDLKDTANSIECAGIAANQISYNKRIFIGLSDPEKKIFKIYINPKIINANEKYIKQAYKNESDHWQGNDRHEHSTEACLSFPGASMSFPRYDKIQVEYMDEEGAIIIDKLEGFISQIFQHETDHLDGKTVAERLLHSLSQNRGTILPVIDNLDVGEVEIKKRYTDIHKQLNLIGQMISERRCKEKSSNE
tara:strand:- start:265 stop:960 length:696 start_codon:yes stop_codon:yes gene_type:complete